MNKIQRDKINSRLQRLAKGNHDQLTADLVIEDARNSKSPLHDEFEWDLEKAAHRDWVNTANRLINGFKVNVAIDNTTLRVPAYVRTIDKPLLFVPIDRAAGEREVAIAVLRREIDRVRAALGRAQAIAAGLGLEARIEELEQAATSLLRAIG